jgi:Xaa-Pro aminopeptidase
MILPSCYARRRAQLAQATGDGVVLVPTAPEMPRNRDSFYPYRHDSYFYYLTGFSEPEAVLAMVVKDGEATSLLFCREKNAEREIWDGYRHGPEGARDTFGLDQGHAIGKLPEMLPQLLSNQSRVHTLIGATPGWDKAVTDALNAVRALARTGVAAPDAVLDVRTPLDAMRRVKDEHETALMRRAAEISCAAHARAMRSTRPGSHEYQVEAELMHEFLRHGAMSPAYGSIVASGPNACVLHYHENNRQMRDGELLLIDAGCEYQGYASDITRTFPVSGRFTGAQRDVYELVLATQMACIAEVGPGMKFDAYHERAIRVLAQGFIDLGLCQGSLDGVIESGDYKRFYMHRAGHWLGMDVHDAGDYRDRSGTWATLEAGNVLTVEPGAYIRPGDSVPEHFWNIGVRIEDDILVTATGVDNLTAGAPKTVADVEAAMRNRSPLPVS